MSFKIESQLSENQIESDVASYLGYLTPIWSKRFRLISVDEQTTGADKLFNRFLPIYLQFKVSHGLNPTAAILPRVLNKPLARIIGYRNSNNLSGNPVLYFQLRKKANTAIDFQHNILHKMNLPPMQYGLYVAPLTLDMQEYEKLLDRAWYFRFYPIDPFIHRQMEIHDTTLQKKLVLGSNPFLRNHIAIPPHEIVTTHEHHYSFSKSGGDVAWHSGELLNDDFRLSTQLARIFNSFYYNRDLGLPLDQFVRYIRDFRFDRYRRIDDDSESLNDPYLLVSRFGKLLKTEFNIRLMILTEAEGNRKDL